MPLYWVAASQAGNARALSQAAQQNIAAALAAGGWIIAAGIAWWNGPDQPQGNVDVEIEFDPGSTWKCCEHPFGECYGLDWGCEGSTLE